LSSLGSWSFFASHADLLILLPFLFFLSPHHSSI
jgi:hypothetical protein